MSPRSLAWSASGLLLAAALAASLVYVLSGWFRSDVVVNRGPARAGPGESAAVILSGDMGLGWGMAGIIASRLAGDGRPVLAINSLAYYSRRRSPAETATLLATAIDDAARRSPVGRVVLIGQSFGADMLQVGLARLPPALRRRVQAVILVVRGENLVFKASPAEMLDLVPPEGSALPTARRLDWVPVTCIRGAEESDSLCPLLRLRNVRQVTLPGGHRLNFDATRLYLTIRHAIAASKMTNSTSSRHPPASR